MYLMTSDAIPGTKKNSYKKKKEKKEEMKRRCVCLGINDHNYTTTDGSLKQ